MYCGVTSMGKDREGGKKGAGVNEPAAGQYACLAADLFQVFQSTRLS